MNDKFFDLKKEKQDRMINAALKVFALKGYEHASTDDIVKEASISKGLLFHYFISKLGLYTFIYDYSVKYVMLELSTGVDKNETDYFNLCKQVKQAQVQVMNTYPYMVHFLNEFLFSFFFSLTPIPIVVTPILLANLPMLFNSISVTTLYFSCNKSIT